MRNKIRTIIGISLGMLLANAAILYAAEEIPAATGAADISEDQTAEEMLAAEAALRAQEAQAAGTSEEPGSESTNPLDSNNPETVASGPPGSDDDFVPTIQISEDLSVSFPVDI